MAHVYTPGASAVDSQGHGVPVYVAASSNIPTKLSHKATMAFIRNLADTLEQLNLDCIISIHALKLLA